MRGDLNWSGVLKPGLTLAFMVLVGVAILLGDAPPAQAHRVYVYAWVEGGKVYTESYFSSGDRVRKGLIEVYGPEGKKLLEGRTNDKGEFSFPIPQKTDLKIVLNAAMGHKGQYVLRASELGVEVKGGSEKGPPKAETKRRPVRDTSISESISEETIKRIVEEALDARLKPIARSIALLREKKGPGLTEVVGGIGYIFGLMGVIAYLRSRTKGK